MTKKSHKVIRDCAGEDWYCREEKLIRRDKAGKEHHVSNVQDGFTDADLRKVVKMENERNYYPKKRGY